MRKKILFKFVNRPGLIPGYLIESKSTLYPDGYYVEYKVTNDDGTVSTVLTSLSSLDFIFEL